MLKLKKVAVTGGLACGKSSVCRLFKEFGAYIVSTDDIVHQLLSPESIIGRKIIDLLGSGILSNGLFDHKKIASKVFNSLRELQELEKIIHPAVLENVKEKYDTVSVHSSHTVFIAEIPLLFEVGAESYFDKTIAVTSDNSICCKRFQDKTRYSREDYEKRMAMQLPPQEKADKADFVIVNNTSLGELKPRVKAIFDEIIKN